MVQRKSKAIETNELCKYGCGKTAKFISPGGHLMCESNHTKCPVNITKNSAGIKESNIKNNRDYKSIYVNLPVETKEKMNWNKGNITADFSYDGVGNHKGLLVNKRGYKCEHCGLSTWMDKPIALELEHIDGDNRNNNIENLELLCPNCHSLTPTWRGRDNTGKLKVTDEVLIDALSKFKSIRQALISVGLSAKGANYYRCYDLIYKDTDKLISQN